MLSIMAGKSATRVTKFGEKTGEALAKTVICDIPRAFQDLGKYMKILEFTSKEAAASLMSLAAPL